MRSVHGTRSTIYGMIGKGRLLIWTSWRIWRHRRREGLQRCLLVGLVSLFSLPLSSLTNSPPFLSQITTSKSILAPPPSPPRTPAPPYKTPLSPPAAPP